MKIALCLIVKGTDEEAELLERCLANMSPYVDGIFITSTYTDKPNENVEKVTKRYKGALSTYKWTNNFSEARTFNFSQVPKDYDYIMWSDADDMWYNLQLLRPLLEKNPQYDALAVNYLYDFDEYNQPIVIHKKTMVIRNDDCAKWFGRLHEDLIQTRELNLHFSPDIQRQHKTNDVRITESKKRNVLISEQENKENPNDPRTFFNLANSYFGNAQYKEAVTAYNQFIEASGSDDEIFLARMRVSRAYEQINANKEAILNGQIAIGMRPDLPDAYLNMAEIYDARNNLDKAIYFYLEGLIKKPQYHAMIAYNPRDYDYNPMKSLAKVYFRKDRPDLALGMLKGCLAIDPNNKALKGFVEELTLETERMHKAIKEIENLDKIEDTKAQLEYISKLPVELQSHPAICKIRNRLFPKTESTGKDIAYFCGFTDHEWNPDLFKTKGFGGSEEAVINLSRELVKEGYNVTVYNNCGIEEMERDGVKYKPFWAFNYRDKWDKIIFWRSARAVDGFIREKIDYPEIYIDLHDVISEGELNESRLKRIKKIFVKTKAHRDIFPAVPEEKFAIIPNGHDVNMFTEDIKRDQYLMVNTSSPDRSMDVLPKLFKEVKKRVPQARLKWAYGWDIFDKSFADDDARMKWKAKIVSEIEEAGIEALGKLPQAECAKLYQEGNILAYPSEFYEIDCISVKKAQFAGCLPITTDFAAFNESVQFGVKVHSPKNKDNWALPYQNSFGLTDEKTQQEWVDACVKILNTPIGDRKEMVEWASQFAWSNITKRWIKELQ